MRNYFCKNCRTVIRNAVKPSVFNCPKGGQHQWSDLGEVGATPYQCKKCGILVESKPQPSPYDCPESGTHQWSKLS